MDAGDGQRAATAAAAAAVAAPGGHGGAQGRKRFGELFGPVLLSPIDALEDARQRLKQRRLQPTTAAPAAAGQPPRRGRRVRFDVADGSDMDEDDEWEDEDDEPRKQGCEARSQWPNGRLTSHSSLPWLCFAVAAAPQKPQVVPEADTTTAFVNLTFLVSQALGEPLRWRYRPTVRLPDALLAEAAVPRKDVPADTDDEDDEGTVVLPPPEGPALPSGVVGDCGVHLRRNRVR